MTAMATRLQAVMHCRCLAEYSIIPHAVQSPCQSSSCQIPCQSPTCKPGQSLLWIIFSLLCQTFPTVKALILIEQDVQEEEDTRQVWLWDPDKDNTRWSLYLYLDFCLTTRINRETWYSNVLSGSPTTSPWITLDVFEFGFLWCSSCLTLSPR